MVIASPTSLKFRQLLFGFRKCGVTQHRLYRDSLSLRAFPRKQTKKAFAYQEEIFADLHFSACNSSETLGER